MCLHRMPKLEVGRANLCYEKSRQREHQRRQNRLNISNNTYYTDKISLRHFEMLILISAASHSSLNCSITFWRSTEHHHLQRVEMMLWGLETGDLTLKSCQWESQTEAVMRKNIWGIFFTSLKYKYRCTSYFCNWKSFLMVCKCAGDVLKQPFGITRKMHGAAVDSGTSFHKKQSWSMHGFQSELL